MELKINNTAVELFESQEIVIQQNSPLVGFRLQGDKTYSFNIPSSDSLKGAVGAIGHLQKSEVSSSILGSVRASGRTAIDGKVKVRKANDRAATLDVISAPGGMDASWWNGPIQSVDLGGDTFLTEEKTIDIVAVSLDKMINITLPSVATVSLREILLKKYQYRMRFFDGNTAFYEHVFMGKLYQEKRDFDEWILEAQTSFDNLSNETNYFYINDKQISVKRTGLRAANLKITIEMVITAGVYSILYEIVDFQSTKYLSIFPGTRKNVVKSKPYFFTTILANNFYGEKPGAVIALNTKDINGELILNNEQERTEYPLSPSFRWKWIFEKLAAEMGFTLVDGDWSIWKDKAVCSMVDMAQQCPVIAMPFNVYQTAIKYADYMPVGYTVKDMFDEFGLITGTTWDFDLVNKQLRLIQIDPIFDAAPQVIDAEALDLRDGINYEDVTRYKLNYSTVIEAEKAIAPTGYFDDMPVMAEGYQLLPLKLLPLIPFKFLGNVVGSQCLSVGKSVFFDLKEQTPAARVFWYNAEQDKALTEMNGVSLSRESKNGLFEKLWKRMLSRKKGKKVKATCNYTLFDYLKLDFFRVTHHRGVSFLINQKQIKLKNNRKYHDCELEIEIIS
jgi:hypothetical protein